MLFSMRLALVAATFALLASIGQAAPIEQGTDDEYYYVGGGGWGTIIDW